MPPLPVSFLTIHFLVFGIEYMVSMYNIPTPVFSVLEYVVILNN